MPKVDKEVAPDYSRESWPVTICKEESLCKASEMDAVDINKIMARFDKTGLVPYVTAQAMYADVSQLGDYRDALERVSKAEEMFMELPVKVRNRFGNDPGQFLAFCSDPANVKELTEMGLIVPKAADTPPPATTPAAQPAA